MQVDFYQLSADPVEKVLPAIAQRILESGERLLVVDEREGVLEVLSRALWQWQPDSFLAHGITGDENDTAQPILLSGEHNPANSARHVALTDGIWRDWALDFDRAFYFFDAQSIEGARACWRDLAGREGVSPRFWRQEGRKWVQGP